MAGAKPGDEKRVGVASGGSFVVRNRVKIGKVVVLLLLPILLFVHHSWAEDTYLDLVLDSVGYILLMCGVFGRLWCTLYIGGRKNSVLQRTGPYSLVRHPLYGSSLLLGLGVSALSENPVVLLVVLIYFAWQYVTTIRHEESELAALFGDEYAEYRRNTPCFFPKFSHFDAGPEPTVGLRHLRAEALRCTVALLAVPMFELLTLLHVRGVLPFVKFP